MTEPTTELEVRPEVADFVARVRQQLADLDLEEQSELTDGLEADLTELVAERGTGALGEPSDYARELRTAAGLDPTMGKARVRRGAGSVITGLLDACWNRWDAWLGSVPGQPAEFLATLRPVWWVARAWVAVQLLCLVVGVNALTPVPSVQGPILGLLVTVAAVVVSVQMGRGRLWPGTARVEGTSRGLAPRLVLLGLNLVAIVMTPVVLGQFPASGADEPYVGDGSYDAPGLAFNGQQVENIFPYDATGHPLTGVQLFDGAGHQLKVDPDLYSESSELASKNTDSRGQWLTSYPWMNGARELFNVFPLAMGRPGEDGGRAPDAYRSSEPPKLQPFPLAVVPAVTLPGVTPSTSTPGRLTPPTTPPTTQPTTPPTTKQTQPSAAD